MPNSFKYHPILVCVLLRAKPYGGRCLPFRLFESAKRNVKVTNNAEIPCVRLSIFEVNTRNNKTYRRTHNLLYLTLFVSVDIKLRDGVLLLSCLFLRRKGAVKTNKQFMSLPAGTFTRVIICSISSFRVFALR